MTHSIGCSSATQPPCLCLTPHPSLRYVPERINLLQTSYVGCSANAHLILTVAMDKHCYVTSTITLYHTKLVACLSRFTCDHYSNHIPIGRLLTAKHCYAFLRIKTPSEFVCVLVIEVAPFSKQTQCNTSCNLLCCRQGNCISL